MRESLIRQNQKHPISIDLPNQLLVEGRSAEILFETLAGKMGIKDKIQVQNFRGNNELRNFLHTLKVTSGFDIVVSVGIIRDAESNPYNAFRSVCTALENEGFDQPSQPEIFEGANPRIGALILPNANECGMLETLCLQSASDDPAMKCINDYFDCLEEHSNTLPKVMDKARIQAFLASRERTIWLLGEAAQGGYWQWDSPAFDHVKLFLASLASTSC
jgi:hypothetical protein